MISEIASSGTLSRAKKDEPASPGRQRNLVEYLVDSFVGKIQSGILKPDDKLPTEACMMREHGVSRTVVREALSRLQAFGIVEKRHGIGTFVREIPEQHCTSAPPSPVTLRDVIHMMELRISLETEAAALAAMRASRENIAAMRALLEEFALLVERREPTLETDNRFHVEIAKATGNNYFVRIFEDIGNVIPQGRVTANLGSKSVLEYLARTQNEHKTILDAIENRDPESARAAVRVHLNNSRDRLPRMQEE